ncbi:MAG TPA: beta-galactosidase trimerization domain-containing protein, partial [Thermoanaerobaculia bacterium]|nr:beta-galactosidase trimerization domain-containing protein [Thermoanaerobaculia bacterium]
RVAPDRVATSHAAAPNLFTSPLGGDGSPDDWRMAKVVDFWGTSFYPKHSFPVGRDPAWRSALLDFTRSATGERGFWVGELQAGFGTVALRISSTVTPSDLRIWMWSTVAHNAKAVNVYAWYPMSSGYESGGFGLIHLDGRLTERSRAAGEVAKSITRHADLLENARPQPSEVAIVYNPLSYMVGGRRPLVAAGAQGEVTNIERNSLLGTYRALFPMNVGVDFVHLNELPSGAAGRYKVIFLPYPLMISESAARALARFVRDGGTLVAEARAAWNDERGRARETIPGHGLHEVCGCRETAVQSTPTAKTEMAVVSEFAGLRAGEKLKGVLYEESLEAAPHADTIARFADGTGALTVARHGKGRMITIGTFLGAAYEADRDETTARFLRGIVESSGVTRPVESSAPLEIRVMRSGAETLIFAFNHAAQTVDAEISIRTGTGRSARDLETGAAVPISEGRIRRRFEPESVWVVAVRNDQR